LFLLIASSDGVRSLVNRRIDTTRNTTSVSVRTTTEQIDNEGSNKFTSSKQRFNIPSTYRGSTSNYDPSESSLFPVGSRVSSIIFLETKIPFSYRKQPKYQCHRVKQQQISDQMNFLPIIC
jgi:hypothetical protein